MDIILFDVDGTLTPSRGKMDPEFKKEFLNFQKAYKVCFVTGSDDVKTIEQVGEDVFAAAYYSFNCSGNQVFKCGKLQSTIGWTAPDTLINYLEICLEHTHYTEKYGNHIERRPGMVNFSVVGRDATQEQRDAYYEWDKKHNERSQIATAINWRWADELQADVGGEISIDIFPKGKDKAQILDNFKNKDKITFFGDRTEEGGNDYTLAKRIIDERRGEVFQVKDWKETWKKLKRLFW
jgi:phosphomannomutase